MTKVEFDQVQRDTVFSSRNGSFHPRLNPDFLKPVYSKYTLTNSMSITWIHGSNAESWVLFQIC